MTISKCLRLVLVASSLFIAGCDPAHSKRLQIDPVGVPNGQDLVLQIVGQVAKEYQFAERSQYDISSFPPPPGRKIMARYHRLAEDEEHYVWINVDLLDSGLMTILVSDWLRRQASDLGKNVTSALHLRLLDEFGDERVIRQKDQSGVTVIPGL
jgi:hypothetical protein